MIQRILALVVAAGLAAPWPAAACSCVNTSLQGALDSSDAVFVGKVIRIEVLDSKGGVDTVRATLEPLEVVKGTLPREVEFITSNGCCYCDFWFDIAETYLMFADGSGGNLSTSICSRSGKLEKAGADLKELGLERFLRK